MEWTCGNICKVTKIHFALDESTCLPNLNKHIHTAIYTLCNMKHLDVSLNSSIVLPYIVYLYDYIRLCLPFDHLVRQSIVSPWHCSACWYIVSKLNMYQVVVVGVVQYLERH